MSNLTYSAENQTTVTVPSGNLFEEISGTDSFAKSEGIHGFDGVFSDIGGSRKSVNLPHQVPVQQSSPTRLPPGSCGDPCPLERSDSTPGVHASFQSLSDILPWGFRPGQDPKITSSIKRRIEEKHIYSLAKLILSPMEIPRLPSLAAAEFCTLDDDTQKPDFERRTPSPIFFPQQKNRRSRAGPLRLAVDHSSENPEEKRVSSPYYLPEQEARYVSQNYTNDTEDQRSSSSNQAIVEHEALPSPQQNHWMDVTDIPYIPREPSHGVQRRPRTGKRRDGRADINQPLGFGTHPGCRPARPKLAPDDSDEQ
ncbi:hypothetical protein JR316_0007462 [Psilocybe cubensis]|uniref:Uncharacterized protein n=2 Tax=Psilocybe cubensis TaxID=181762 RepID=A0ACB8H0Y3_PSICU|nr:hypothetical protein JR316_0007462 [Psilocybe cubensis]KAH9480860.1 hypothetical protein JR316_0007462 [Psilocybe cubensis]